MKILHITKKYPEILAGDSVVVLNYESNQINNGDEVFILTSNSPEIIKKPNVKKFGLKINRDKLDVINLSRIITLIWLSLYSFWYLKKINPDIIHSHSMDMGFAVSLAAHIYRIPIINTCHGISFNDPAIPAFKRHLELFFLKAGYFKLILTVDKNSLTDFAKNGFKNVQYFPNAIDVERFSKAKDHISGIWKLFYVGRIEPEKGINELIEAVQNLPKSIDWELTVTSGGRELKEYCNKIKQLELQDKIHLPGPVDLKTNAKYFASSHIFIMPSLHEGFPTVLLEAWAAGLPVIITKVGNVTAICENNITALLVDPGSSKQLTDAVIRLINDPNLRRNISEAGYKKVRENYSYNIVSSQLHRLYQEIIK